MPTGVELLDGPEFTICHMLRRVRGRDLHAVSGREHALYLAIEHHALETAGIIRDSLAGLPLDREEIVRRVHLVNPHVLTGVEAVGLAAFRVADDGARPVLRPPLSGRV